MVLFISISIYFMSDSSLRLSRTERKATLSIAAIYALRMFGLFMIVPIFMLFAHHLKSSTPFLIGVAMGCYGLTQALFQMPLGVLSDHKGRKPVILFGLVIFVLGSIIAALSHTIWGVMIGRCLQGAGAVGSATSALLADLTRVEHRTKAMAIIGITIGTAFSAAMVLGPILASHFSGSFLFWLSALCGIFAMVVLRFGIPATPKTSFSPIKEISFQRLWGLLRHPELMALNMGVLILHALLTANFLALPVVLQHLGFAEKQQWHLYLPVLLVAFLFVGGFIRIIEKKQWGLLAVMQTVFFLAAGELGLLNLNHSLSATALVLCVFFTAFTLLEALLPSAVSKLAPAEQKGAALGIFSSFQFAGIFVGGILGGWVYSHYTVNGVFGLGVLLVMIWVLVNFADQISSKTQKTDRPGGSI
jgi:MFS family permease